MIIIGSYYAHYKKLKPSVTLGAGVHTLSVKLTASPTFAFFRYCSMCLSHLYSRGWIISSHLFFKSSVCFFSRGCSETSVCWQCFRPKVVLPTLPVFTFFCLLLRKVLVNDSTVQSVKPNFISSQGFLTTLAYTAMGWSELPYQDKLTW